MDIQLAIDKNGILDAGSSAIASTAAGSVAYVDLGAEWEKSPVLVAQLGITAIVSTTGDEDYTLAIQTSDTTTFTVVRGSSSINILSVAPNDLEPSLEHIVFIPKGRYCRLYCTLAGDVDNSITFGNKVVLGNLGN